MKNLKAIFRPFAKTMALTSVLTFAGFTQLIAPDIAIAETYEIDTSHSRVGFKIRHLAISNVLGNFKDFSGVISYDPKDIAKSNVSVSIKSKSIDTDNKKRDDHLKNKDFFDVTKFPAISYKSKSVEKIDDKHFKVNGELTIRDTTKEVPLNVEFLGAAKDPWGNERVAFTATSKINRKDFGIKWNKLLEAGGLVVGDNVKIEIDIEGIKKK